MDTIKKIRALGLMSSPSLDGIAAALIVTDGIDVYDVERSRVEPYDDEIRERLQNLASKRPETAGLAEEFQSLEEKLTRAHAAVAQEMIDFADGKVDVIGFHGHTLYHNPEQHFTYQMGDGELLADLTGKKVVNHFVQADLLAGGQGGPLVSIYYASRAAEFEKPVAVAHIGAISSLTWVGDNGELMAFDAGPGNAQINDWVFYHAGLHMDYDGKLAISGKVNDKVLVNLMRHKFFAKHPPKALDRNAFKDKLEHLEGLSLEDGAATVTEFAVEALVYSMALYFPAKPKELIVCGGGAKNPTLMRFLRSKLPETDVITAGHLGWRPDTMEAQAMAFLATRRLYNLPATFPLTTGVKEPQICGEIWNPKKNIDI